MDPRRFDSLTRALAAPKSRRGFLGSLAALGAGLLGSRTAEAQVTQAQCGNKVCAAKPGACTNGCVCCVWDNGNSRCVPPGSCSGMIVRPGTTTTTTAAPTATSTSAPTTTTAAPTTTTTAPPSSQGTCAAEAQSCMGAVFLQPDLQLSMHSDDNRGYRLRLRTLRRSCPL